MLKVKKTFMLHASWHLKHRTIAQIIVVLKRRHVPRLQPRNGKQPHRQRFLQPVRHCTNIARQRTDLGHRCVARDWYLPNIKKTSKHSEYGSSDTSMSL